MPQLLEKELELLGHTQEFEYVPYESTSRGAREDIGRKALRLAEETREFGQGDEIIVSQESKRDNREVAFVMPVDAHSLEMLVDPSIAPEVFKAKRFKRSIEKDFDFKSVDRNLLQSKFFSRERGLFDPVDGYSTGDQEYDRRVDRAIEFGDSGDLDSKGTRIYNVNQWLHYRLEGDPKLILHPDLGRLLGALLAREIKDTTRTSKSDKTGETLLLEDLTRIRDSKRDVRLVGDHYNLADEITDEHEIPNLDRIIRKEISNPVDRARALGKAAIVLASRFKENISRPATVSN